MTTNNSRVDIDALVREARMERSFAIGNAIASVLAAAWNGSARLIAKLSRVKISRASDRPAHAAD